jgi:hypothetical protein
MDQWHISLSITPLFGDLCQHIKINLKCTNILKCELKSANWCQTENQLIWHRILYIWIILPSLGLFSQTEFIFLSLFQKKLCFRQIKISFKTSFDQKPKILPFSHNQISLPLESSFCNKRVLIRTKYTYTKILKKSQVIADPVALTLISSPLALSTKTEELVAF